MIYIFKIRIFNIFILLLLSHLYLNGEAVTSRVNSEVIHFDYVKGFILIEAEIDNIKGKFILDTGSSNLVLNGCSPNHNFHLINVDRDIRAEEIKISYFRLGSIQRNDILAWKLDLGFVEEILGTRINGLVGSELLSGLVLHIDYVNLRIAIFPSLDDSTNGFLDKFNVAHLKFEMGKECLPLIYGKIGEKNYRLGLDSGANVCVFDETYRNSLEDYLIKSKQTESMSEDPFLLESIRFQNSKIKNISVVFRDLSELNSHLDKDIDGIMSLNLFNADHIILDFKNRGIFICWKKTKDLAFVDEAGSQ